MSTRLTIVCDGCGARSPEHKNAGGLGVSTVRGELRLAGWETLSSASKDYCPACRKKRETAKKGSDPR